ncbi:MAG: DMT family transporter [Planctomycetota bacterium]
MDAHPALAHRSVISLPMVIPVGTGTTIAAYVLLSLGTPLTKFIMESGQQAGVTTVNPISFCNLLFLGNFVAAALSVSLNGLNETGRAFKRLTLGGWWSLLSSSFFSILAPAALYFAIRDTAISHVILISRVGPILYAIGGTLILGKVINAHQRLGYGLILLAIVGAVLLGRDPLRWGDGLALVAAASAAAVSLSGRLALDQMDLRSFVFARNAISALVFAIIALVNVGPSHFSDLVLPSVAFPVIIYGVMIVGGAQLLWFRAIQKATPQTVGGWSFVSPLMAILATSILLNQQPHGAQWVAFALVFAGMIIVSSGSVVGNRSRGVTPPVEAALSARA